MIIKYYKQLVLGGQIKTVGLLTFGILIGQIASFLVMPFLTHLLTPNDLGVYAIFLATLSILATIATLRFELSIPIPKVECEAFNVLVLSCLTTCLLALLLGTVIVIWPDWIAFQIGIEQQFDIIIWVLPLGLLFSGLQQSLNYWHIRNSHFRQIAQSRGGYGIIASCSQLTLSLSGFGGLALAIGEIIGRLSACMWLINGILYRRNYTLQLKVSGRTLYAAAKKFKKFAFLSTPSSLLNALSIYLPIIMIARLLGSYEAGLFFLAQRVIGFPTALLVNSISQVFVADFARMKLASDRSSLYTSTIKRFTLLTGPVFFIMGLASFFLFPYIFGLEWKQAGQLAMILSPFYFVQLLSGATVSALDIMQAHWLRLIRELFFLIGTVVVITINYIFNLTIVTFVASYVFFGVIFYSISLFLVHQIIVKSKLSCPILS